MTTDLTMTTEADLAALFKITPERAAELRKRQGWPHVRLTRFDVLYTDAQIAEIVRSRSVGSSRALVGISNGLTARSARSIR